jgi:hypothetical protein
MVESRNGIAALNKLLDEKGQDYRGIVATMIHKFRDMPAKPCRTTFFPARDLPQMWG